MEGFQDVETIGDSETNADADKTEKNEEKPEEGEEEKSKSEIAQKIKYREKFQKAEAEKEELKQRLDEKEKKEKESQQDEADKKAKEYLRGLLNEVLDEREKSKIEKEEKDVHQFEEAVDELLEDNKDIAEKDLLDVCESLVGKPGVTLENAPHIALEILKKKEGEKKTPKMPTPKRGTETIPEKEKEKPPVRNLYQLGQWIKEKYKAE